MSLVSSKQIQDIFIKDQHMSKVNQNIITPVADFKWAFITKSRENLSGVKQYSITLSISKEEAAPILKAIEDVWAASGIKKPMKSAGYKTNEETGMLEFNFKTNETFADGTKKVVSVYDAKGRKVDLGDRLIGNGSRGRVNGTVAPYESGPNAGITLYLNSIQLTKFVEYEGGDGFEAFDADPDCFTGFELDEFESVGEQEQSPAVKF